MKKLLTTSFVISSLVLAPALKADTPSDTTTTPTPQTEQPTSTQEGTPVGQAAQDGTNAAKKKKWQNIALAAGAVVVAVTALVLIANNDGHKN